MTRRPRILVTRAEPDAAETAARLEALGLEPVRAPLLEMRSLPAELPAPDGLGGLALTSANALRALEQGQRLTRYLHLPVFAVGARTADHARAAGFADVASAQGDVEALAMLISGRAPDGPVFYPAARHTARDLAATLAPAGIAVHTAHVYEMTPAETLAPAVIAGLKDTSLGAVSLYSRRTAATFVALAGRDLTSAERKGPAMLCLSANVAEPLIEGGFTRVALADYPSEEAMMALALSFARAQIG